MRSLLALPVLALLAGCGPVQSSRALVAADVEIEGARSAGAATAAPYELTAAEAYLHKAREQSGYAQYESATTFATRAAELAREAHKKAAAATPARAPGAEGTP
ncbi:MAG: DUF4398 domain-containing protein [Anaeromyxobacter sp.]|nr:DUF4398 domain-containing protein [Anaeromyxobacter sp.]MBL0276603.1 DUF4398 domain-containing protein [Anaeromyxobacter sp.]